MQFVGFVDGCLQPKSFQHPVQKFSAHSKRRRLIVKGGQKGKGLSTNGAAAAAAAGEAAGLPDVLGVGWPVFGLVHCSLDGKVTFAYSSSPRSSSGVTSDQSLHAAAAPAAFPLEQDDMLDAASKQVRPLDMSTAFWRLFGMRSTTIRVHYVQHTALLTTCPHYKGLCAQDESNASFNMTSNEVGAPDSHAGFDCP